jgi:hypothetical protein
MGNNDISVIGYQGLWMVISYPIKPDPINLNTRILEEIYVMWQILYPFSIPKTEIMITSNEYLMGIRQFDVPIEEVKHLFLSTIIADVTAMNDDISIG